MDALDVLKLCLRRWYVVIPVVLLALAAGLGLAHQQKPTYTAFGSYALVYHSPPTTSESPDPLAPNPLAADGAVLLGEALAADFMSSGSQTALGGVGHRGTAPREAEDGTSYSVSLPEGSQSYLVQTWGKDPEGLRTVVNSVLAAAPDRAATIQDRAGAPKKSQYTTFVTGSTQLTKLPPTSRLKLLIAMLGVGILAGSALSLVLDRLMQRRKNQRSERDAQDATSWEETPPAAEAEDSQTLKVPVADGGWTTSFESEWVDVMSTDVDAKSEEGGEFVAGAAPEYAVEEVYATDRDGLSTHEQLEIYQVSMDEGEGVSAPLEQSEDVSSEADRNLWVDQTEAEQVEDLSRDQAEGIWWIDQTEEPPPAVNAEEVSSDHAEERWAERPEELPVEQESSARQATDLEAEQSEDARIERTHNASVEQAGEAPTEQVAQAPIEQHEDLTAEEAEEVAVEQHEDVTAEEAEEVAVEQPDRLSADSAAEHGELSDKTNEKSQVNQADTEHQEPETKSRIQYGPEPDFNVHWNDDSGLDDGPWPVMEPERGFEAEDVSDSHSRQHQPTH